LEQVHYNLSQAKKFFGHNVSSCLDFELKWGKKFFDYILEKENQSILTIYRWYLEHAIINESGNTIMDLIEKNKEAI
jgi:hypothetical protein